MFYFVLYCICKYVFKNLTINNTPGLDYTRLTQPIKKKYNRDLSLVINLKNLHCFYSSHSDKETPLQANNLIAVMSLFITLPTLSGESMHNGRTGQTYCQEIYP